MYKSGFTIVQVLFGLAVLVIAVLAFTDLLDVFRKQEKFLQKRYSQVELVSLVASQFQNYSRDEVKCFCCRALNEALPTGINFTRSQVPADCPLFTSCNVLQPLHGFRMPNGLLITASNKDTTFVSVAECSDLITGILKVKIVGTWGSSSSQKIELSFVKGNY